MDRIAEMTQTCAAQVYGRTPPSPDYARRVASLLLGTAATESHFKYRRQRGYDVLTDEGAWGFWQSEGPPLNDSLLYLAKRPSMARRAAQWLYGRSDAVWPYQGHWNLPSVLRQLYNDDRLACLMARIHYMRFPEPVPAGLDAQAAYYKRYYNTELGAGSAAKYIQDYETHVSPEFA